MCIPERPPLKAGYEQKTRSQTFTPHPSNPPKPPKPVLMASAPPCQMAPNPVRFGQSYCGDNDMKEDVKDRRTVKGWFPPKSFQMRTAHVQSPLQCAEMWWVLEKTL